MVWTSTRFESQLGSLTLLVKREHAGGDWHWYVKNDRLDSYNHSGTEPSVPAALEACAKTAMDVAKRLLAQDEAAVAALRGLTKSGTRLCARFAR